MERVIELFINTEDGEFFDRGGMLAAYNPAISAGELVRCEVQLCSGAPAFNASGELLNPDTSFAGTLAAGEIIIDNNFNWYDEGTLLEALTSGTEISELSVSSEAAPRPIGTVQLDSDTVVNFCGWEKTEGGYRLTLADAEFNPAPFTPSAAFDVGAAIRIIEQPIIVSAQNDDTGRDTGRFSGLLDAANPVYESLIEGNESIPSCRLEFSIYLDGRAVFRARHLFDCDGAMAMTKGVAYLRADSWREADSRYIKQTDWKAAPEYQFSENAADWHDDQTDEDLYYRERRSGGEWGEAIKLKAGPQGPKGDPGESGIGAAVGSISLFAGAALPEGYLLCDGAALSRTVYNELFEAIGTTWGAGNGETTFNLPDFSGKFIRGTGGNAAALGTVQAEGLPNAEGWFTLRYGSIFATDDSMFTRILDTTTTSANYTTQQPTAKMTMSLSGANPIFGASNHVTPENCALNIIIKY